MPEKVIAWRCTLCDTLWLTRKQANDCEANCHYNPKRRRQ